MKVVNVDKDGKIIDDLSKVKLPNEMAEKIVRIIWRERKEKQLNVERRTK